MNTLLVVASAVTALATIITCGVTCYKVIRRVDRWKERAERHDRENYLNILRLIIMNENMPLEERISAGDKYISEGGNGAVKHFYQELIEKL